jgi:hypothetical protein
VRAVLVLGSWLVLVILEARQKLHPNSRDDSRPPAVSAYLARVRMMRFRRELADVDVPGVTYRAVKQDWDWLAHSGLSFVRVAFII